MRSNRKKRCFSIAVLFCVAVNPANAGSESLQSDLDKYTDTLSRYADPAAASADGYAHYDGYDTFSMGEHWYNRSVYESGTCMGDRPSHLQYLRIDGTRRLIGTGYLCLPRDQKRPTSEVFDQGVEWHTHGPAWCLLPNGSNEDYRDLADALPNKVAKKTWQEVCALNGGRPAYQPIRMLHTWNWIPAPHGVFSHENLAIPFLRVGLPVPDPEYLNSAVGESMLDLLRLAHGDTQWWYWRGMEVAGATPPQRAQIWPILEQARMDAVAIVNRAVEIHDLDSPRSRQLTTEGREVLAVMKVAIGDTLRSLQGEVLESYLGSIHTHTRHAQPSRHAHH